MSMFRSGTGPKSYKKFVDSEDYSLLPLMYSQYMIS